MKRIFCLFLALVMVFSMSMPAFAEGETTEPVCNCQAGEGAPHLDTCPLYTAPEQPAAHEHSYSEAVTTEASCFAAGVKTFTCANDGCDVPSYTESIEATGLHTFVDGQCTTPGCTAAEEKQPEAPVCTGDENCTLTEGHNDGCTAAAFVNNCTAAEGCTADAHNEGCPANAPVPLVCTKAADCPASDGHEADCVKAIADAEAAAANAAKVAEVNALIAALPDEVTTKNYDDVMAQLEIIMGRQAEMGELWNQLDLEKLNAVINATYAPVPVADVAKVGETGYATLQEAITAANGSGTVTLLDNVTLDNGATLNLVGITLDLGGYTLTLNGESGKMENATITNGTVNITTYDGDTVADGIFDTYDTCTVTNVNFTSNSCAIYAIFDIKSGELTITGGSIAVNNNNAAGGIIYFNDGDKLTMNGVTVNCTNPGDFISGGAAELIGCNITITGTDNGLDNGINNCALTLDATDLTVTNAKGRGLTSYGQNIVIKNGSSVIISGCEEANIAFKYSSSNASITVDASSSISETTIHKISYPGTAIVNDTEITNTTPDMLVSVSNGTVTYTKVPDGSAEAPFVISSLADFQEFSANVSDSSWASAHVKLGADIDLSSIENWTPISKFSGVFDGDGHTIKGLKVSSASSPAGLFGELSKGTIKNFTLESPSVSGGEYVGAVVGRIIPNGTVDGVTVTNAVVSGSHYVGGVAGSAYGSITNCKVNGLTLTCTPNSTGSGYDNGDKAGGILGYLGENGSYRLTGNEVSGASITAYRDVGGILGMAQPGNSISSNTSRDISIIIDRTYYYGEEDVNASALIGRDAANVGSGAGNGSATITVEAVAKIGETPYSSLPSAFAASEDGNTVTLVKDTTLLESTIIDKSITLDLGGNTVTTASSVSPTAFRIINGKTMTVKNGTIDSTGSGSYCFILGEPSTSDNKTSGNLNIESGTYKGQTTVASVTKGTLSISGGSFSVLPYQESYDFLLNCIDANYKAGTAIINVTGGSFENFDPNNNAAEGAKTNFVAEGYGSYKDGNSYAVVAVPELPTATVTEIENAYLTMAMNFKADEATAEQLAYYGSFYADFVLTLNKDVTFNANGNADGWLSGQYDNRSENWVNVPFEDVKLEAGESIKIMEYAASHMGQSGLKLTYNDVYSFVKDFDCGVFFSDAFLKAYPDLEVTLELRIYNNKDESESYIIGEANEFTNPLTEAKITDSAGKLVSYGSLSDCIKNAAEGQTVNLLRDVTISEPINVTKSLTIDGNGNTLTYTGADRAITVDSSANGADLTVRNLDIVIPGYSQRGINYNTNGSLTIENVSISDGNGGSNVTYAVNLPSSSDGATVTIRDSELRGNIALNLWGENITANITNSDLYAVDNTDVEDYAVIKLNNNGTDKASGLVLTLDGGSLNYLDNGSINKNKSALSNLVPDSYSFTNNGCTINGKIAVQLAISPINPDGSFYSMETIQDAVDYSTENGVTVSLLRDVTLTDELVISGNATINTNGRSFTIGEGGSIKFADTAAADTKLKLEGMDDKLDDIRAALPGLCVYQGSIIITQHSLSYTASGAVITESCDNNCGHSATATLETSKSSYSYTGTAITPVTVTYSTNWLGTGNSYKPADSKILYFNNVNVGTTAKGKLTIDGASAEKGFEIVAAELDMWEHSDYYRDSGNSLSFTIENTCGFAPEDIHSVNIYTSSGKLLYTVTGFTAKTDKNGDIVVTVPASVMAKLGTGRYDLKAQFTDGNKLVSGWALEEFRVRYPRIIPSTGDTANFLLWGGLLLGATAALGGTLVILKKKGKNQ